MHVCQTASKERGKGFTVGNRTRCLWSEAGEARSSFLMLIPDKEDWAGPLEKQRSYSSLV